jgi:hypothetical protein
MMDEDEDEDEDEPPAVCESPLSSLSSLTEGTRATAQS